MRIQYEMGKDVSEAAATFVEMAKRFRYVDGVGGPPRGLTNFTLWAGAGFSKSWDSKAPVGKKLFTLKGTLEEPFVDPLVMSRLFGLDTFSGLDPDELRRVIYQLDMYERYPEIRTRYVDEQNLRLCHAALRTAVVQRYRELAELDYFDTETGKISRSSDLTSSQAEILWFFTYLLNAIDGSQPHVEGIRTHFVTTNYDFVVEAILDRIVGPDDSALLYSYRGFTPSRIVQQTNPVPVHQHWYGWNLLKINGGFEIHEDGTGYELDYSCRSLDEVRARPPVLMLPSREQNYSHTYFRQVFPKAVRLLRESTILVLVGYSFPEDDALIRFVLRQFAEEAEDARTKCIFYIDPNIEEADKRDAIADVFPSNEMGTSVPLVPYQGTFGDFAAECVASGGWKQEY